MEKFSLIVTIIVLNSLSATDEASVWPSPTCSSRAPPDECAIENVVQTIPTRFEFHPDTSSPIPNDPATYTHITFNCITLNYLPNELFLVFKNVETIQLSGCSLLNIMRRNFDNGDQLRYLHLEQNKLIGLRGDMFCDLVNLEYLNLFGNQIRQIESNTFARLRKLQTLNLAKNHISDLGWELFQNLTDLEYLFLNNNELSVIDRRLFETNINLKTIDLSFNKIMEIHEITFDNLNNLIELNFGNNRLKEVVGFFNSRGLTSLERLDLSRNEIENLFKFEYIGDLEKLDLSHNRLSKIDYQIFVPLNRLEKLYINGNNLSRIVEFKEIVETYLLHLKEIGLAENRWDCNELKYFVQSLRPDVVVVRSLADEMANINGIFCVNYPTPTKFTAFGKVHKTYVLQLAMEVIGVATVVFISYLIITFVGRKWEAYRRRHDPHASVHFVSLSGQLSEIGSDVSSDH